MGRIHDEHRVKLEADGGSWLHVLHAGQQQCGEQFTVAEPPPYSIGHFLQEAIARGLLQEPYKWLDFR